MSLLVGMGWRRGLFALAVAVLLTWAVIEAQQEKEIALVIGEPWETMRQRSSAEIPQAIPGHVWGWMPKTDARLRLADPQYGFVTPLARYLSVTFDDERVATVRMSPQIEPLLLDDTLKVVLDLQDQWRQGGWTPRRLNYFPSFADTPEWRAQLRDVNKGGSAYWGAGDQYQAMLVVSRFKDDRRPTEERYLITLGLSESRGWDPYTLDLPTPTAAP
ncbi:hypothetical protein SAMN04487857_12233 [Pseudomonas sp. ok272]|uniref:hypothetical protein n=1 Tax=unclassified Pseudomonas TaxID=196821 RepID=UPI0008BA3CF7|nr:MULTISPECIES: hypothetical protein [unclassified Pseudomonas]SEN56132.1 hypothetical protein SAMN04487857_12233 [Pseudomonas sp. ok272]SFN47232.1 hypothetical protein SAMN04487858_1392 [Pseudomonas sp. ok602]